MLPSIASGNTDAQGKVMFNKFTPPVLLAAIVLCLVMLPSNAARGEDFHVGLKGHPFAALDAGRDAARKVGIEKPRRILVHGGRYFMARTLVLDARDSGLTIEAAGDGEVIICGGKQITGWEKDTEQFWSAKVPEAVGRKWDFRMLVVNGRFCKRARYPKDDFLENISDFNVRWSNDLPGGVVGWTRKPTHEELTTLKYRPEDLSPWLDINNAELTIYAEQCHLQRCGSRADPDA